VGRYSSTIVETEGPFWNRHRNNFSKDLGYGVTPKGCSYIMVKERKRKEMKNQPDGIWMLGS